MEDKSLIITADDFGRWPEVNDAVLAGYDGGILSSASLRVTATASRSAMVSAGMRPGLGVGLYLVLCEGQATLPRRHIPNLVDSAGRFVSRPLEAMWLYRRGGGLRDELKAEIQAQIEKFMASGLDLTHIAGSFHLHLHPTVVGILKELSEEYPIAAIRKPCGPMVRFDVEAGSARFRRRLEIVGLRTVIGWGRLRARAFVGPDRVTVLNPSRPCVESELIATLRGVGKGVTELVCQPGSLLPRYDGVGDAATITSPSVRQALDESGLDLISYQDLIENL